MSNEETERTALISGDPHPQYAFQSSILRQRNRRVKQFQCCMCAILLSALTIVFVTFISYSITDDIANNTTDLTANNSDTSLVLLKLTWPNSDSNQPKISCNNITKWKDAWDAGKQALKERDRLEENTPQLNINSPSYKHQKVFVSSERSLLLARGGYVEQCATKYFHRKSNATKIPTICLNNSTTKLDEACRNITLLCSQFQKYRSYNGTCNNLDNPAEYGVALTTFRRAIPPEYGDGISSPRKSASGGNLPSARAVSLVVHRPYYKDDPKFTVMLAVWGQFLDHDITATALSRGANGTSIACCTSNSHPECFPVELGNGDPYYDDYNITCMDFVRSAPAPTCCLGPREQYNQATAFIDGSVIYGSSEDVVQKLRSFVRGFLIMEKTEDNRSLLPISHDLEDGCNREKEIKNGRYCFLAGDSRANENLHLTSMHLIWARQHNRIATQLANINPVWDDERIFQEARRIIAAQMQHITFNEFVPVLIGSQLVKTLDLRPRRRGYYKGYNATIDPSVANNFATSAFRFAHSLIPGLMKLLANDHSSPEYVQLHNMLFDPFRLYKADGLDKCIRGAMHTSIEASDAYFTSELKQHLFEHNDIDKNISKNCGLDLVSLNIQRGRDHGLPGYTRWRQHCGLLRPRTFYELAGEIDKDLLKRIQSVYRHVDDIDLYTGAISEKPLAGGILGPTLTCLIMDQFVRIKRGDRFWYETPHKPQSFTREQLTQLRKTSLATIICDNSDNLDHVQPYVMERVGEGNENIPCSAIPRPDLAKWKDGDLPRTFITNNSIFAKLADNSTHKWL